MILKYVCVEVEAVKKPHKRKTGWGSTLRIPRPRRVSNDGKNMMQRAQELKKVNEHPPSISLGPCRVVLALATAGTAPAVDLVAADRRTRKQ